MTRAQAYFLPMFDMLAWTDSLPRQVRNVVTWPAFYCNSFCAGSDMEQFTVSLRLGSRIIGRVVCTLNTKASLADAKGTTTSRLYAQHVWVQNVLCITHRYQQGSQV